VAAAIASGLLTVSSGVTTLVSCQTYHSKGAQFLLIRHGTGVTTLDNVASIASVFSLDNPSDTAGSDSGDRANGPYWNCSGCGEENPANFEECWKCREGRPEPRE
jgi:hypothetical protein